MNRFEKLSAAVIKSDQPSILLTMDPDQIEEDRRALDRTSGDNSTRPNIPNTSANPPAGTSHLS